MQSSLPIEAHRHHRKTTSIVTTARPLDPSWHTETSYEPSWRTEASHKLSKGAAAGGASVSASSQHTDPNDRSFGRNDRWEQSKELGLHKSDRGNAWHNLKYSSTASQFEDSERVISALRREVRDLRLQARDQSPAKERPRNKVNASKRKNPEHSITSLNLRGKNFAKNSCSESKSWSLTPPALSKLPLETARHSRSNPPFSGGRGPRLKDHASRKTAHPGGQHAVWKALDLVSSSPFSKQIEKAELPERYTTPRFEIYNGRTDPVAHIGLYQQSMALSRFNDPLMCRLFPSSLGEVALSRKTREMDALLTMKLENNESIKEYSTRFWETYNDIDGCDKEVEEDGSGTTSIKTAAEPKVITPKPSARPSNAAKSLSTSSNFVAPTFRAFEMVFREPIYKLMEKIKREPFFVWPPKLLENPALRDGKLYCTYHKDTGHMTENCHMLKVHLEKLVSAGHLNQYVDTNLTEKKEPSQTARQPHPSGMASAGVIHVIHNPLCSTISSGSYRSEIQKATHLRRSFSINDSVHPTLIYSVSRRAVEQIISFSDNDLKDVQLPHNDPLVITLRIGNYDVQRLLRRANNAAWKDSPTCPGRMRAIPSTLHQKLRFPTKDGIMELNGDQVAAKQCVLAAVQQRDKAETEKPKDWVTAKRCVLAATEKRDKAETEKPKDQELEDGEVVLTEQPEWVYFDTSRPELFFLIGSRLSTTDRKQLLQLLTSNRDVFAWSVYDALRVSTDLACHVLNISPEHKPIAQKRRKLAPERATIVLKEVERLLESGAIREVQGNLPKNGHQNVRALDREDSRGSRLRLNASKCTFGVSSGKFLGYMVSRRGIEANPNQIAALIELAKPRNIKQGIKTYLSTPPCLSIPNSGEPLFLYLVVSDHVVSAVLVRELGQEQKPIFFVSKAMDEKELRYLLLEKVALALFQATKKLPHYFQSSTVIVLSDLPLKMLLQRLDFSGRITKWGVHLRSLCVEDKPRTAIKGQILAEFLAEFQYDPSNPSLVLPDETQLGLITRRWELFVDGASNSKGSRAGIVLVSPEGLVLEQAIWLKFSASNNEAKYEALMIGLRIAKKLGAYHLQSLLDEFDSTHVTQIGREHNSHVDILAKLATALESDIQRTICIETLDQPSFQSQEVSVCSISDQPSWMDLILKYIKNNELPDNKKEANMIKRKASKYWVSEEGSLYRRSFTGPYLLCVRLEMVKNFLFEIHEGICGSHTGGRSLAHRAISQGYWWPYMQADALKYVRESISDNGTQFESRLFKGFCSELGIKNFFSSPGYPQSNGQAEVSNKIILSGIKKKLEKAKGKWVEELPSILWTHRTTVRKATGETPFALAYGVEAVIPLEIGILTTRTTDFVVESNEDNLRKDLDLVEERRDLATVWLASYQQQIKKEHDKNVKPRIFRVGELVLRKVMANTRKPNEGKLGPNWEGPYKIISLAGAGSYRLEDLDGKPIPRPWNTCNLRKYFFLKRF
uniref:Integrase catalytic domain-containing protein n=1 Tax=Fagus sylvatica TaxID=28930 RepID=A0A2N9FFW9_FAGSY